MNDQDNATGLLRRMAKAEWTEDMENALLGAVNEGIGVIEVQHVPPGIIRTRHIPGTEFWSRKDSE